jgi:pimeloyl-ACP methyl ester carboxylesterase
MTQQDARGGAQSGPHGPCVVAVPGLGLTAEVPARTLRLLPAAGGTATVELPGYGIPAAAGSRLDPGILAVELLARLDDVGVDQAVLFGHSASCQIVVEAAARAPGRVAGLVLVGPTCDPRALSWPALAQRWLRTAAWERPGQVPLLAHAYRRTSFSTMARAMDAARHHRIDHALAGTRCPTLVVRGRHDRIAPADWASVLADIATCGAATTLPVGGHMVPLTHPRLLADRIGSFLRCALTT